MVYNDNTTPERYQDEFVDLRGWTLTRASLKKPSSWFPRSTNPSQTPSHGATSTHSGPTSTRLSWRYVRRIRPFFSRLNRPTRPSHPTRTPPASAPTPGRTPSTSSPTSPRTTSEPPAPLPTARPPHRSAPRPRCSRRWNALILSASGGRSRSSAHSGPTRTQDCSTAWRVLFGSPRSKRRVGRSRRSIRQSLRR